MTDIPRFQAIKYAGNKSRLLDFLIPIIRKELMVKNGDTFVDLFAGTCSVGYALKSDFKILANDIQAYSETIGKAILENNHDLNPGAVYEDIIPLINRKIPNQFSFFYKNYSNTYYSPKQCSEIDSIRYAISQIDVDWKKNLYLVALMYAMTACVSSPGHFAEFFPPSKSKKERQRSILEYFLKKCSTLNIVKSKHRLKNQFILSDYRDIFLKKIHKSKLKSSVVIYADPPYSASHYSRFYHLLETLVRYDQPSINYSYKGRYRNDRYFSPFSRLSTALPEFENMFKLISENTTSTLIVSYMNSNRGLVSQKELIKTAKKYYNQVQLRSKNHNHSMQGAGKPMRVEEYVLICR